MDDHRKPSPARVPADPKRRAPPLVRAARLLAANCLMPLVAHAACQVESVELPVRMVGPRAMATVGINGTPVPLIVDSGAFFSMLTDAAAAQLKLRCGPPRRCAWRA